MIQNPKQFNWIDPTTNLDGSPIVAGEISGYNIGIRPLTGTVGTYPITIPVAGATVTQELLTDAYKAGLALLKPGQYQSAIQSKGVAGVSNDSAWGAEIAGGQFEITVPVLNSPSGFSVA